MKIWKAGLAIAAGITVLASPMLAKAASDNESVNIDAVLIQGITLTEDAHLDFGVTVLDGTAGTVDLVPDAANGTVTVAAPVLANQTAQQAELTVFVAPNVYYTVTLPLDGDVSLTCSSNCAGTLPLPVIGWNFFSVTANAGGVNGDQGLTANNAEDTLAIGASLNVAATQTGVYSGAFDVTVEYP